MIFKKAITLKTDLSIQDITLLLKSVTRYQTDNNKPLFEGKIYENKFTLYPLFEYESRELFRPEINGNIVSDDDHRYVKLNIGISFMFKILFYIVITFNIIISLILMVLCPKYVDIIPPLKYWWVIPIFILLIFVISSNYFHYKADKSINIIRELIKK